MAPMIERLRRDLEVTWQPVSKIRTTDPEHSSEPDAIEMTDPWDPVYLIAFEMNGPTFGGLISLCYQYPGVWTALTGPAAEGQLPETLRKRFGL